MRVVASDAFTMIANASLFIYGGEAESVERQSGRTAKVSPTTADHWALCLTIMHGRKQWLFLDVHSSALPALRYRRLRSCVCYLPMRRTRSRKGSCRARTKCGRRLRSWHRPLHSGTVRRQSTSWQKVQLFQYLRE